MLPYMCSIFIFTADADLPEIILNGQTIEHRYRLEYFGITSDRSLLCKHHVDHILEKKKHRLSAVKVMAAKSRRAEIVLVIFYNQLVNSVLHYRLRSITLSNSLYE